MTAENEAKTFRKNRTMRTDEGKTFGKDASCCKNCGRKLIPLEVGATRKFINRGATEYLCLTCLAEEFHVTEALLLERIEYFKKQGCTLF